MRQLEDCLGLALERGVRIVTNAGGLNPAGLAERVREVARGLGLDPAVAHVEGDDLRAAARPRLEGALTANAYLGGFGIAAALDGRRRRRRHRPGHRRLAGRRPGGGALRLDARRPRRLAGAVVAGHVLECGTQATGGNFSGFRDLVRAGMDPARPLGFPLAEIAADGSSRDHQARRHRRARSPSTPSPRSCVYEVAAPRATSAPTSPPTSTSSAWPQDGPDRVRSPGSAARRRRERLKVCVNELGGFRNTVEFVLTGLDVEAKADWVRAQLTRGLSAAESVTWSTVAAPPRGRRHRGGRLHAAAVHGAWTPSPGPVGRAFTGAAVELALASYPGFTMTAPPARATPYGVYRPEYVDRAAVTHDRRARRRPARGGRATRPRFADAGPDARPAPLAVPRPARTPLNRRVPLGTFVHARSGDKGGDANIGLWVAHDGSPSCTTPG